MIKDLWLVLTGWLSSKQLKDLDERNKESIKQFIILHRQLREMDNHIFAVSQCTNQASLQKALRPLLEGMTARKEYESKRITEILRPELERTYGNES